MCRTNCGNDGQACCALQSGVTCAAGMKCAGNTCKKCGGAGQPCCSGGPACGNALVCFEDACSTCGKPGEPCCAAQMFGDDGCPGDATCNMGRCNKR